MELQVEGRHVEIRKSWQTKIDVEKDRLVRHHAGLVHNLRVAIEATSNHREGGYEVRLIATIPDGTVVVKRKGESVKPLLVKAFDNLGLQLKEMPRKAPPAGCPPSTYRTVLNRMGLSDTFWSSKRTLTGFD